MSPIYQDTKFINFSKELLNIRWEKISDNRSRRFILSITSFINYLFTLNGKCNSNGNETFVMKDEDGKDIAVYVGYTIYDVILYDLLLDPSCFIGYVYSTDVSDKIYILNSTIETLTNVRNDVIKDNINKSIESILDSIDDIYIEFLNSSWNKKQIIDSYISYLKLSH